MLDKWLAVKNNNKIKAKNNDEVEIFNENEFMDRMINDKQLALEISTIFLNETPIDINKLSDAVESMDFKQIEEIAHGIKGACANVSGIKMKEICFELESAGKEKDVVKIQDYFEKLNTEFDVLKIVLEEFQENVN